MWNSLLPPPFLLLSRFFLLPSPELAKSSGEQVGPEGGGGPLCRWAPSWLQVTPLEVTFVRRVPEEAPQGKRGITGPPLNGLLGTALSSALGFLSA